MQYSGSGDADVWEPRTSWVLPSLHRNSRRLLSDVGRAARAFGSGNALHRTTSLDGLHHRMRFPSNASLEDSSQGTPETFSFFRMSRDEKLTLLCLAVVDMFSYLCMSIMAPFFPAKVTAVGASQTVSGGVFAVYALTVFVASPVFAKVVPLLGAKFTFISGIFLAAGCNFLFGLLEFVDEPTTFTVLAFVIRIFEGIGAAAFSTASFTILAYEFSGNVAVVFGTLESFVGLGMTIGPAMGGFLFAAGGFKLPFFVVGSLMMLTVPLNMWLLPTHIHVVTKPKKGSQKKFFKNPSVYIVCFTILIMAGVWGFLDPTLQPHLDQFHLNPAMIGLVFLLISSTYAICSPIWGWVAEKLENTDMMMIVGLVIAGVALLFLGPSPFFTFLDNQLWINLLCLAVLGPAISMSLIPTFESLLCTSEDAGMEENIGTYALVSGVWGSAYSLGEVVGPALGGYLDDLYGFEICSTVIAALCFLMALAFITYVIIDWCKTWMERRKTLVAISARKAAIASYRRINSPRHYSECNTASTKLLVNEDRQNSMRAEVGQLFSGNWMDGYGSFNGDDRVDEYAARGVPIDAEEEIISIAVSV